MYKITARRRSGGTEMDWKLFALFLSAFLFFSQADAFGFAPIGADGLSGESSSLLLQVKKKKHKHNDDSDGDSSSSGDSTSSGKHSCPEGYVVLDKANKYGAFCEVQQGLCPTGFDGSPPNCTVCGSVSADDAEVATTIFKNERPQCKIERVSVTCQKAVNGTSECCCHVN
jgi:hypothetical protein